jgi:uncharacterized delta-60 repeat protein
MRRSPALRPAFEPLERRTLLNSVVVNSIADTATGTGIVTLRDAIATANGSNTPTSISFDPSVFAAAQTIVLNGTELELTNTADSTTIQGPSAGVTISGNATSRVLSVNANVTASLIGLSIIDGNASAANDPDWGGGIEDNGTLSLYNVTVSGNSAAYVGGGIYNSVGSGQLLISATTIAANTAALQGGGFFNDGNAVLDNVTVGDNTAPHGAGIWSNFHSAISLYLDNCTVAGNVAVDDGGGIENDGIAGQIILENTIDALNTVSGSNSVGPDVAGPFATLGGNLIGITDDSTGFGSTDFTGTAAAPLNPLLGPLADNGGPTLTFLPLTGSPAINHAINVDGIAQDQRGLPRMVDGISDIGSVEVQNPTTPAAPIKTIGGLDPTFGSTGLASNNVGFTATNGVAADGSQSVLIGPIGASPTQDFGLTRYNANGSLDTTFGVDGVVDTSINGTDSVPTAVAVLSNGNILVAGTTTEFVNGFFVNSGFAVAEYNASGAPLSTFGSGGQIAFSFLSSTSSSHDVLNSIAVAPNGTIYLGGSTDAANTGNTDLAVAALTPAGALLSTFGVNGLARFDVAGGDDVIHSLAVQKNGDILAAGSATVNGNVEVALARLLTTGKLDPHFGVKGIVTASIGGEYDSASSVAIQPNGDIVLGGITASGSGASLTSNFVLQRYTTAGKLDRTFGGGAAGAGSVITNFGQPSALTQIVLQANGDIIASGKTTASLTNVAPAALDVAIARYTIAGKLDTSFNDTGMVIVDLSSGVVAAPNNLIAADASALGAEFTAFTSSLQGTVTVASGGEILDAGSSGGGGTVEAELVAAGVDLVARLLSTLPASALSGATASITFNITESGTQLAAGTATVTIQLATDTAGDSAVNAAKPIVEHISFKQSQGRNYRLPFSYPAGLPAGSYYLVATVADGPTLSDLNTNNNAAASSAISVAPPYVNLAGSTLTYTPGKLAVVNLTLTNTGNVIARGRTTLDLYLSTDDIPIDGTELPPESLTVSLPSGKSKPYRLLIKVPSTLAAGNYNLLAILDPLDNLRPTDTTNALVIDPTDVTLG